jgi:hypothetical protein
VAAQVSEVCGDGGSALAADAVAALRGKRADAEDACRTAFHRDALWPFATQSARLCLEAESTALYARLPLPAEHLTRQLEASLAALLAQLHAAAAAAGLPGDSGEVRRATRASFRSMQDGNWYLRCLRLEVCVCVFDV